MAHSSGQYRCPAPRDQCYLNGDYQITLFSLPLSDNAHVKFKNLPFQRIIRQIVPPVSVRFSDIMEIVGLGNTCNNFAAEFFLTVKDVQRICQPNQGLNARKPCQLQIRIGEKLPGIEELSEVLPQPITMSINNKQIPMDNIQSPLNFNAIDYLHLNTVHINYIKAIWPQCMRVFYMVANLVETISVDELVSNIKIDDNRFFSALNTKQSAVQLLRTSKDVSLKAYKLTLLCPINKLRMKLPAKSVNCNHLQCFDLHAFISSNEKEPTWMCPICMNPCNLADLKIDSFILFIINSLNVPKTCMEIEIYANGKWKPCNLYSDPGTSCGPSKKTIIDIDLSNSDDEDLGDIVRTVLKITK